jgi:uncharacterized membrane protein SpoIIM required for sporulation
LILNLENFIQESQPRWHRFEKQLDLMEGKTFSRASLDEIQQFNHDYKAIAADLTQLRTFAFERELCTHLESLVARAALQMQASPERRSFNILTWFTQSFPQTFRKHLGAFWLSLSITLLGCCFGIGAVALDPPSKSVIMPFSHLMGKPSDRVSKEESILRKSDHDIHDNKARFSAQLMTHNTKVSMTAMSLGLSYGIGTAILLFYNGVILGAVIVDYVLDGQWIFLMGWLLPHGSIEIPAILLAGQSGLILAAAMIKKNGRLSLTERLKRVIPDVGHLICGVAIMLIWAGIIESFLSQYHEPILPYAYKITLGICELFGLIAFLSISGKKLSRSTSPSNAQAPLIQSPTARGKHQK